MKEPPDKHFEEENDASAEPAGPLAGGGKFTRREFIIDSTVLTASVALAQHLTGAPVANQSSSAAAQTLKVSLTINNVAQELQIDPRVTLLDALRERLALTGTKKGCDHGQCGACTVLVNGRRVNSCLTLAATCQKAKVTTVEGLATGEQLHPVQAAFVKHDAFQCGYCTSGQICSAVGLLAEGNAHTDDEIRELMSGNICRCGAYENIVAAIRESRANT